MASSSDELSDYGDHIAAARALLATRTKKQRSEKRNLRRSAPLKSGLPSSTPPRYKNSNSNDEEKLLQQCQAIYSKLPKRSRYAQHKLKCLAKAMALLQRGRYAPADAPADAPAAAAASLGLGSGVCRKPRATLWHSNCSTDSATMTAEPLSVVLNALFAVCSKVGHPVNEHLITDMLLRHSLYLQGCSHSGRNQ
jgi:hypothetical protein